VLTQAYELQECDSLNKSLKNQVFGLNNTVMYDKILIDNQNGQLDLISGQLKAISQDNVLLKDILHLKDKKIRQLNVGLFVVTGVGVVTNALLIGKVISSSF